MLTNRTIVYPTKVSEQTLSPAINWIHFETFSSDGKISILNTNDWIKGKLIETKKSVLRCKKVCRDLWCCMVNPKCDKQTPK